MRSAIVTVAIGLVGCGSSRSPSSPAPLPAADAAVAAPPVLPPLPPPATIGALSSTRIAGPPVSVEGLVAGERGIEMLINDFGRMDTQLGRLGDDGWTFSPVTGAGPGTIAGRLAARGDEIALTVLHLTDERLEVRSPDPGSDPHVVCDDPGVTRHGLVLDADGPAIAHTCADELRLTRYAGGVWRDQVLSEKGAFVLDAAIDHLGAIHVMTSYSYVIADGDRVVDGVLPAGMKETEGIGSCGGRVWGAFAIEGDPQSTLMAGTWNGSAWELEPVSHPYIGPVVFGFDEACRPFLAIHESVYARSANGWVGSYVPDAERVKALAVRDGVLYVAFERVRNGVEVGVATGPVD
jgi:hypothetical protein